MFAKRGAVATSIGVGSDASDSDDDGLRSRPVKKGAADRVCRVLVPARPEPVDDGSVSSGCERQRIRASSRCTLRKADAKGDYSLSEDDKDDNEEFPEFRGGGLAKFYDFRTCFVKFLENGSRLLALPVTTSSRSPGESERHGRSQRV